MATLPQLAQQARVLAARLGLGTRSASRSLPIRGAAADVRRPWNDRRAELLAGIPARSATLRRGHDQGDWGTTWTVRVEFRTPVPARIALPLAGKVIRRLKAAAETGEIPTTDRNPAYRPDAGQEAT